MLCWSTGVLFHFVNDNVFPIFALFSSKGLCMQNNSHCIQTVALHYVGDPRISKSGYI